MRVKTSATDLRAGMLAFLPYFGELRKAKIIQVSPPIQTKVDTCIAVAYEILSEPKPRHKNQCFMKSTSVYEVYTR